MSEHVQAVVGGLGKAVVHGYVWVCMGGWEHVGVDGHTLVGCQYSVRELWGLVGRGRVHA